MFNLESALRDMECMISSFDKKLFVRLYGNLISENFQKRLNENEDSSKLFDELCVELLKKSS